MPTDSQQLTQAIYDLIYDALTMAPPIAGAQAATSASSTLMSLALPGLPLDPAEFANPWTPTNPSGDPATVESFAWLVDATPEASASYVPNGQSVDALYGQVVYANVAAAPATAPSAPPVAPKPTDPPMTLPPGHRPDTAAPRVSPAVGDLVATRRAVLRALPAKTQRAFGLLYTEGTLPTPQGRSIKTFVESPAFRRYLDRRAARDEAVTRYMTQYLQADRSDPAARRRWDAVAQTLEAQVRSAEGAVQDAQASEIEDAMALTGGADGQNNSVAAIFANARLNYELGKLGSMMGPGLSWHMTLAQPQNWLASNATFFDVNLQSERALRVNDASRFPRLGGAAAVSGGLWQHGAQGRLSRQTVSRDTVSLHVRFKYARVNIRRPWLDLSLFSLGGWSMAGRARHQLSTGSLTGNVGIFPLLPTSMIVAKDLQITARWSHEDVTFIRASLARKETLAFGPFALAGRFQRPRAAAPKEVHAAFDGVTIAAPGLQVIGWISKLMPACPPLDG